MLAALTDWDARQWGFAVVATLATALVIGLPTDVIPNPVFGRPVPVAWWSYPVLATTALLGGLLAATYVSNGSRTAFSAADDDLDAPARAGGLGGLLTFFAVGCPVCNKLVVIALGTVGARQWFEPFQPVLAVASISLLVLALRARLRGALACPVDTAI